MSIKQGTYTNIVIDNCENYRTISVAIYAGVIAGLIRMEIAGSSISNSRNYGNIYKKWFLFMW